MLVYDFIVVNAPFDGASGRFAAMPGDVIARALDACGTTTPVVALQRRPDRVRDDAVVIDFGWAGLPGTTRGVARFDGELQCAPLADGRTHLSVSGSYELWGTRSAGSPDFARAHREVEVQMRAFLRALRPALDDAGPDEADGLMSLGGR